MNESSWITLPNDGSFKQARKRAQKKFGPQATILDYQQDNLMLALSYVTDWTTAIDGGANYGIMSYHMSKKFQKVLAFEIDPDIRACFEKNMQNFNCSNVEIESCGLGETSKNVNIVRYEKSFANHVDPEAVDGDYPLRSIDSYNFDSLGFIKLDCEGYEPFIIQGAEQTIKKYRPVILMERKILCKKFKIETHYIESVLWSWGYRTADDLKKDIIMVPK
jgi:FkbM family methyltransferase